MRPYLSVSVNGYLTDHRACEGLLERGLGCLPVALEKIADIVVVLRHQKRRRRRRSAWDGASHSEALAEGKDARPEFPWPDRVGESGSRPWRQRTTGQTT